MSRSIPPPSHPIQDSNPIIAPASYLNFETKKRRRKKPEEAPPVNTTTSKSGRSFQLLRITVLIVHTIAISQHLSLAFAVHSCSSSSSRFRSRGMELQRFRSNTSSKRSKRPSRHSSISSLLTTKPDEYEAVCISESDIDFAANSLMMFANAGDGSLVLSNPQELAALDIEEPFGSVKLERRKKRIRTKKILDTHFDSCADQEMKYKCKTCTRKFFTFQALGGHRASCHNKFRSFCDGSTNMHEEIQGLNREIIYYEDALQSFNRPSSVEVRQSLQVQFETSSEGLGNRAKPAHECPVCYRVFSSGQALGGHKRCHSVPPVAAPVVLDNSPCLSTIEEERQPVKALVLLDLNMPPPVEEEDYCIDNDDTALQGDGKWCSLTISS